MEPLGRTLKRAVGRSSLPHTPDLQSLQNLPSTTRLQNSLQALEDRLLHEEDYRVRRDLQNRIAGVERALVRAPERDAIQATRPADCWCLGTGGRHKITANLDVFPEEAPITVFLETCHCPEGLMEKERRDREIPEARRRGRELERQGIWDRAGIPRKFLECRIETWPSAGDYHTIVDKLTTSWRSLMFTGPVGTGKTGLAVGYAWECLRTLNIYSLRFIEMPNLLAELRSTYNHPSHEDTQTEQEVIDKYAKCGLLILDDLGVEHVKDTGWLEDRLYQIVGTRHSEERPTVFTSNLTLDELQARLGERVTWRIDEMLEKTNIINMSGCPNLRA